MHRQIQSAFDSIHADAALCASTTAVLQEKIYTKKRPTHGIRYTVAAVCVMLLLIIGCGGYALWNTPVSYISIDVNPSVELGLNRFDRVVSSTAFNDDGAILLADLDLDGMPHTAAIDALLNSSEMSAYLTDNAALTITVSAGQNAEALLETVAQCSSRQYGAACVLADTGLIAPAHEAGLSFGKYKVWLELQEYTDAVTIEDCRTMSMRALRAQLEKYTDEPDGSDGQNTCGTSSAGKHSGGKGHHGNKQD